MIEITLEQLKTLAPGGKHTILAGIAEYGAGMFEEFEINTPRRVAHFMAQLAHESAGFRTTVEYASGAAYEGREDLGNDHRGDGRRFKGRGLIQCTGRANYREFTAWLRKHDPRAVPDFEKDPAKLAEFPYALLSAVWYWTTRKLNALADRDDLRGITKRINGGFNGFVDRQNWFRKAWAIWGTGAPIRYAGKGKDLAKSKTVWATAALGGTSLSAVSEASGYGANIWSNVKGVLGDGPWLLLVLLVVIFGASGYLIYSRWRQAQQYDS